MIVSKCFTEQASIILRLSLLWQKDSISWQSYFPGINRLHKTQTFTPDDDFGLAWKNLFIMIIFFSYFYYQGFSDYCLHLYCYFHISADMSSSLHQVFVELGNLHRTSNYVLYWIHRGRVACSDSISHNRVQELSILVLLLACSQTPKEGRRTYWLKHCGNNNEDEDNSLKTL